MSMEWSQAPFLKLRMWAYHRLGRTGEAVELAREAVRQFPDNQTLLRFLSWRELNTARALYRSKDFAGALAATERVVPQTAKLRLEFLKLRMEACHRLGRTGEAVEWAREVVRQFPDNQTLLRFLADRELDMARALYRSEDFAGALTATERVVPQTAKHRLTLLKLRMEACHRLGRTGEAVELAREADRQFPDNQTLLHFLAARELDMARALYHSEDFAGALAAAERIVPQTDKHRLALLKLRMEACHRLGRTGEALELAREAVRQFPDNQPLLRFLSWRELDMARALYRSEDFTGALAAADRVVPQTAKHRLTLLKLRMEACHRLGRTGEAVELAREAVQQFPETMTFWDVLAKCELEAITAASARAGVDEREALVDFVARFFGQKGLSLSPRSLRWIAKLVMENGASEQLLIRLNSLPEIPSIAKLLLGMIMIEEGAQVRGAELCHHALVQGLPPHLQNISEVECNAARFHTLSPGTRSDDALVVIEPGARPDMVRLALDQASFVHICADRDFSSHDMSRLQGTDGHDRIAATTFRWVNIPEIAEVVREFSARFLTLALDHLPSLRPLAKRGADHAAALETTLRLTLHNPMRFFFNTMEAITATTARRIFFVANTSWLSFPLAIHLLSSGKSFEISVACGSPSRSVRSRFGELLASFPPPQGPLLESPVEKESTRLDAGDPESSHPRATSLDDFIGDTTHRSPADRIRCIVYIPNVAIFPLRTLVKEISKYWNPILVVNSAEKRDMITSQFGDIVGENQVRVLNFPILSGEVISREALLAPARRLLADQQLASIECRGMRVAPILESHCMAYLHKLSYAALTVYGLDTALQCWAPSFILSQQDYTMEGQLLALAGRRCGIPTLGFQVLLYGRQPRLSAPAVDHFLCLDRYARDVLCEMTPFPPDRVSVIGPVLYEQRIQEARSYDRRQERHALGLAAHEKLVIVATQPVSIEDNMKLISLTLEALATVPETRIVIKLHPNEDESRAAIFRRQVEQSSLADRALITNDYEIYRLLTAADLVVNMSSNVGLEAAVLDRDVVAVEIDLTGNDFSLGELGFVDAARSREQAIFEIRRLLLSDKARAAARSKRAAFFERSPELRDGRSLERLIEMLHRAAARKSPFAI